ncbi:MAG TPA: hypothetical protein VLA83_00670 [Candidatus Binatia bacterium]|nr:hypothetical protein [Candidatus Binatia bacterium]
MRIVALICLCVAGLYGQQAPSTKPAETQTNQQKARALIDQMIQALGGEAYLTAQDYYAEGRSGSFHNETLVSWGLYYRFWKWPDKDRIELTKQRDIVQLYVGDQAYEITYKGIHPLDTQKEERVHQAMIRRYYSLENVLRNWMKEPGILLLDEGPTVSEGHMAEKLTIINSKNESVTILVDPSTHLPLEKRFSTRDPRYRERDEETLIYGDWKVFQGIDTPRMTVVKRNGETISQQIILNMTYNIHPSDALFDPAVAKINPVKEK